MTTKYDEKYKEAFLDGKTYMLRKIYDTIKERITTNSFDSLQFLKNLLHEFDIITCEWSDTSSIHFYEDEGFNDILDDISILEDFIDSQEL